MARNSGIGVEDIPVINEEPDESTVPKNPDIGLEVPANIWNRNSWPSKEQMEQTAAEKKAREEAEEQERLRTAEEERIQTEEKKNKISKREVHNNIVINGNLSKGSHLENVHKNIIVKGNVSSDVTIENVHGDITIVGDVAAGANIGTMHGKVKVTGRSDPGANLNYRPIRDYHRMRHLSPH